MAHQDAEFKPLRKTGQRIFRYWQAIYMSFYSRALYVDVGKNWRGLGILYLFLLLSLLCIPFAIRVALDLNQVFHKQIIEPLSKLPVFYVLKGQLVFDKPSPYLIKNDNNEVIAIIDTTGKINKLSSQYPKLSVLVTKDRMLMKMPSPQFTASVGPEELTKPIERVWSKNENLAFDPKNAEDQRDLKHYQYYLDLLLYPMALSISFSFLLIILLVLGFLGQVFATIFYSFKLSFMTSIRLFILSSTPTIIVLMITATLRWQPRWLGIALMLLLSGYFAFAVFSLKAESKRLSL